MNHLIPYLVKSSLILAIFYLIYWFFLRKEIFTLYMRFYLIISAIMSFILPFISINIYNDKTEKLPDAINRIASFQQYLNIDTQIKTKSYILENPALRFIGSDSYSYSKILSLVYTAGLVIFFILFIISFLNIIKLIISNKIVKINGLNVIFVNDSIPPFSFLNYIFVNTKELSETDLKYILEHEKIHVQQRHSIDILIIEFFKIVLWFNPFIWFLISSLKSVHEYLADKYALKNGCDLIEYQSSVLKQFICPKSFELANSFNIKSIKTRLSMMALNKPSRWAKVKISSTLVLTAGIFALLTCNFMITKSDKVELYYKNGNKKFEAETKEGKLYGPFTCWDSLNHITFKGSFNEKGNVDGVASFYNNGLRTIEFFYKDDTIQYCISSWFENGQLAESVSLDDNKTRQKLIRYYESGAKYEEIEYSYFDKGKSKFILWNENGEKAFSGFYNENILYSDNSAQSFSGNIDVLFKSGKKARECSFKDGIPIRIESEWYNSDIKRTEIDHIGINTNKMEVRTDIKNWNTKGVLTSAGNLTYLESKYYTPFSIERKDFLSRSAYRYYSEYLIKDLKKELSNQKK